MFVKSDIYFRYVYKSDINWCNLGSLYGKCRYLLGFTPTTQDAIMASVKVFLAIVIPDPKKVICHPGSDEDSASLVVDLALSRAAKPWSCQYLECRYHLWFRFRKCI